MKSILSTAGTQSIRLAQVALLMLAFSLILLPAARTPTLCGAFKVLFLLDCALVVGRAWRLGHGRKSPEQTFESLQEGGRSVMGGSLERSSFVVAAIATTVLALS